MSKAYKWAENARFMQHRYRGMAVAKTRKSTRVNLVTLRIDCACCGEFRSCNNSRGAWLCETCRDSIKEN